MLTTTRAPATSFDTGLQPRPGVATPRSCRGGLTASDLIVVLFLVAVLVLVMLMAMPRGREQARLTACQKNLAQIGLALALYDQTQRQLPTIDRPGPIDDSGLESGPGPLKILLQTLRQADFLGLAPNATPPQPTGPVPGKVPVPGLICSSDPNAIADLFDAPISYRGNTGGDYLGRNGVFAPGRRISLAEIEQGEGSSYTAAFSERLVGDGLDGHLSPWNYAAAAGPLPVQGCSLRWLKDRAAHWRGDAGSSWVVAGYRSTLYNHALQPGSPLSCVALDGQSAFMGASSGHSRGVDLLMLDGSVKLVLPSIDSQVWTNFAAIADPTPRPQDP
jgi:type II secretory pathway pseudopilin PulG